MELERGMLRRGAVGAARRPYEEVIQARIDRRPRRILRSRNRRWVGRKRVERHKHLSMCALRVIAEKIV